MTKAEFRERHSEVIEYYQYIEMHLKGICAALLDEEGRTWFDKLDEYDTDPLGKLLLTIKTIQAQENISLFSTADLNALDSLRISRNFWVHQCFAGDKDKRHIVFKNGVVRDIDHAKRLNNDLRDAKEWDEKITEVERTVIPMPKIL